MDNVSWKRYSIFISSTFIDMDSERDAIKFRVINKLNQKYSNRRISFQVIDLRSGINTEMTEERMREDRILNVCFGCIDDARPFFIGLLGERYGWIPSKEKRESVIYRLPEDRRVLLDDCDEVSVTEMEILYGAIGHYGENIDHSLFFYRSPESYLGIDNGQIHRYYDAQDVGHLSMTREKRFKLIQKIKNTLSAHSCEEQWVEYTLRYNPDIGDFEGLDNFVELVFSHLTNVIDREVGDDRLYDLRWWEQDGVTNSFIADQFVVNSINRISDFEGIGSSIYISGPCNTGKSTLLSQLYVNTNNEKHIAFIGMTPHSQDVRHILIRWICEMGDTSIENYVYDTGTISDLEIFKIFQEKISERKDIFFMDNIDALSGEEQLLGWLTDSATFFFTGSIECYYKLASLHNFVKLSVVSNLSEKLKYEIISKYEKRLYFELPIKIKTDLIEKDISAGDIGLTMRLLTGLSRFDYRFIRNSENGKSNIDLINEYLYGLYIQSISKNSGQFFYIISRFAQDVCNDANVIEVLGYIAISRIGLREYDLEMIAKGRWNPVSFAMIMNYFSDYFVLDPITKIWNYKSSSFAKEIVVHIEAKKLYEKLAKCIAQYEDYDCIKRKMIVYYSIKSHCPVCCKEYLALRSHYASSDDIIEWFRPAVYYLKNDMSYLSDLKECCNKMNYGEIAIFLSNLLDYGLKFGTDTQEYISIVECCFSDISVEIMDEIQAFSAGWLFTHLQLYLKYINSIDNCIMRRKNAIEMAIKCFTRVLEINPQNNKANNMKRVEIAELMDVYIAIGDYESIYKLYDVSK